MIKRFKFGWAIWFLLAIHAVVVLAGFIAPYSFETQDRLQPYSPPTQVHWFDCQEKFHARPFVYASKASDDALTRIHRGLFAGCTDSILPAR